MAVAGEAAGGQAVVTAVAAALEGNAAPTASTAGALGTVSVDSGAPAPGPALPSTFLEYPSLTGPASMVPAVPSVEAESGSAPGNDCEAACTLQSSATGSAQEATLSPGGPEAAPSTGSAGSWGLDVAGPL